MRDGSQVLPAARVSLVGMGLGPRAQFGYIVDSLEDAARWWAKTHGVGPFACVVNIRMGGVHYGGGVITAGLDVALAYWDDIMIELIRPHEQAGTPFSDALAAGQSGLHHLGFWPEDYDGCVRALHARGLKQAYTLQPYPHMRPTVFFDDPCACGAMIEIIDTDRDKERTYAAIKALPQRTTERARLWRVDRFSDVPAV